MGSPENNFNKAERLKWIKNTFIFSIPTLLALLSSLQTIVTGTNGTFFPSKVQLIFIMGGAYQTLVASLIDFLIKYRSDNSKKEL